MNSRLAPPEQPLTDGVVVLRVPSIADVAGIAAHAHTPGGLEGTPGGLDGWWLPLAADAPAERRLWIVDDWLRGWAGADSYHGPALLLAAADEAVFVGRIGFGTYASGAVELDYGIAPRWRAQGFATRATMLATEWLLRDRGAREVELRIARGNSASQRVATKAGYRFVGAVSDVVEGTGKTYDDLRYVRAAGRTIGQPLRGPGAPPG